MAVAAKVIGAVRLGLVDIRVVIEELDSDEMQRVPELHMQLYEASLYNNMLLVTPSLLWRKVTRSMNQVLVAVLPHSQMRYFDVATKTWKPLAFTTLPIELKRCFCAVSVGRNLFVASADSSDNDCIYCYDIEGNVWEKQSPSCGAINNLCIVDDYMYAIRPYPHQLPQRYNFTTRQWQSIAKVGTIAGYNLWACNGVAIVHSKVLVLYGDTSQHSSGLWHPAVLNCFDPVKNKWEIKATTCHPHFGSSIFAVNSKLYVAGGYNELISGSPGGNPAPVEVYDEVNNTWSVVEQKRIPSNNLGAVEIEGRVYFNVNKFPIDSGIRIPPEELYPQLYLVNLCEWEYLAYIDKDAILCYMPANMESLNF
ncbi:hypothetical protein OS493_023371 [Desmophyllum pertusum]|uniref:Uncharacterized protein n=1 Tax=Desmophyllum pertusum TaxID=174260 RepID=A0A9X0DA79_9CNID|nr:hypothetical protein OS493_023371 [Desmophyllum pertusum]